MKDLAKAQKLLIDYRITMPWTQKELADRSKVGVSTIARIETAKSPFPTARTMQKLARAFGRYYDDEAIDFIEAPKVPFKNIDTILSFAKISSTRRKIAAKNRGKRKEK